MCDNYSWRIRRCPLWNVHFRMYMCIYRHNFLLQWISRCVANSLLQHRAAVATLAMCGFACIAPVRLFWRVYKLFHGACVCVFDVIMRACIGAHRAPYLSCGGQTLFLTALARLNKKNPPARPRRSSALRAQYVFTCFRAGIFGSAFSLSGTFIILILYARDGKSIIKARPTCVVSIDRGPTRARPRRHILKYYISRGCM